MILYRYLRVSEKNIAFLRQERREKMLKKTIFMGVLVFFSLAIGMVQVFAANASFSDAVLYTNPSYPKLIQLFNIDVSGKYYWGTFKWNKLQNKFEFVDAGLEGNKDFVIPFRTITPDGNMNDWAGILPVLNDPVGDDAYGLPGDDIQEVYIAKDAEFMYFGIKIADGTPLSGSDDSGAHMHFQFNLTNSKYINEFENHFVVFTSVHYFPASGWLASTEMHVSHPLHPNGFIPVGLHSYDSSYVGVGQDFVEWKVPIKDCMITSGKYASAWTHYNSQPYPSDDTNEIVRLK